MPSTSQQTLPHSYQFLSILITVLLLSASLREDPRSEPFQSISSQANSGNERHLDRSSGQFHPPPRREIPLFRFTLAAPTFSRVQFQNKFSQKMSKHGSIFDPEKCTSTHHVYHAFHHVLSTKEPRVSPIIRKNPSKNHIKKAAENIGGFFLPKQIF
jgi:hypothetical protein